MPSRFLTMLTGRNLPKIRQAREPEPALMENRDLRGTAYHEAGHAGVAWALGLSVHRMVIGIAGDLTAGEADIEEKRSMSLVDRIAICSAGGDAQELFDAPTNDICAISDMGKIYDLIGEYNEPVGSSLRQIGFQKSRVRYSNSIETRSHALPRPSSNGWS
jgi:ATP-dependent Zn protease